MMTKQSVHEQGIVIVSVQVCNHRASKNTKQNLPLAGRGYRQFHSHDWAF